MAVENVGTHAEVFTKHSRMGTTRMKYDIETDLEGKKRGVSMERSKVTRPNNSSSVPFTVVATLRSSG